MTTNESSSTSGFNSMEASSKPGADGDVSPPILVAMALPPESSYQTVTIDAEDDDPITNSHDDYGDYPASEVTPLVVSFHPSQDDDNNDHDGVDDGDQYQNGSGPTFRDWTFAVVFYVQIALVIYAGIAYAPGGYDHFEQYMNYTFVREQIELQSDDVTPEDLAKFDTLVEQVDAYLQVYPMRIILWDVLPSAVIAFGVVHAVLVCIVKPYTRFVVTTSLALTVGIILILILLWMIMVPGLFSLMIGIVVGGAVWYYARLVWPIIAFASINLKVALQGVHANAGIYLWAFCGCELGIVWTFYWFYVTFGTMSYLDSQCPSACSTTFEAKESNLDIGAESGAGCGQGIYFLFLVLSGYWTAKVLMNTVEVTISGVMATWCFDKDAASGCCSSAVASSLYRSMTYSFGSICLGSLFQGIVQLLRKILPHSRARRGASHGSCCGGGGGGLCFCVTECCGRVLEDGLEYFTQWAYVFVGIYGYSYADSGKQVLELFQSKGWTSIIAERLASYVMAWITFCMGLLTGIGSLLLTLWVDAMHEDDEVVYNSKDTSAESDSPTSYVYGPLPPQLSFLVGFLIGSVVSCVMMSVVRGGVNTLIVCFADGADKLQSNHPELTQEMIEAWAEAFPGTIHESSFVVAVESEPSLPPALLPPPAVGPVEAAAASVSAY